MQAAKILAAFLYSDSVRLLMSVALAAAVLHPSILRASWGYFLAAPPDTSYESMYSCSQSGSTIRMIAAPGALPSLGISIVRPGDAPPGNAQAATTETIIEDLNLTGDFIAITFRGVGHPHSRTPAKGVAWN